MRHRRAGVRRRTRRRWPTRTAHRPGEAGSGGSIPLLQNVATVAPNAEFILWGAEDTAKARIHASDESVDPAEIEAMTLAQVFLLQDLAR